MSYEDLDVSDLNAVAQAGKFAELLCDLERLQQFRQNLDDYVYSITKSVVGLYPHPSYKDTSLDTEYDGLILRLRVFDRPNKVFAHIRCDFTFHLRYADFFQWRDIICKRVTADVESNKANEAVLHNIALAAEEAELRKQYEKLHKRFGTTS